jgi:hypothetical protein
MMKPTCVSWSPGFSRAVACAPDRRKARRLFQGSHPCAASCHFGVGVALLRRKENSAQGTRRRLQVQLRCRHHPGRWFRNLNLIPFRGAAALARCRVSHGFPLSLRIDSPMANCCSHGTFPHFSLQSSHLNICYYHQDLH